MRKRHRTKQKNEQKRFALPPPLYGKGGQGVRVNLIIMKKAIVILISSLLLASCGLKDLKNIMQGYKPESNNPGNNTGDFPGGDPGGNNSGNNSGGNTGGNNSGNNSGGNSGGNNTGGGQTLTGRGCLVGYWLSDGYENSNLKYEFFFGPDGKGYYINSDRGYTTYGGVYENCYWLDFNYTFADGPDGIEIAYTEGANCEEGSPFWSQTGAGGVGWGTHWYSYKCTGNSLTLSVYEFSRNVFSNKKFYRKP